MRIAQVSRQFYPAQGGIETVVRHLSSSLLAAGHQVSVIALNRPFEQSSEALPPHDIVDGIPVRRIPYWGPRQYAIAPSVLRYVSENDLIHLHSSDFFLDYLSWTRPLHRVPVILSTHGLYFHTGTARSLKKLYFRTETRIALRNVSRVICDSQQDFDLMRQIAPAEKLSVIPNGIDYDRLAALDDGCRNPNLLVSVGRLASNKRFDRMLRAFACLLPQHPAARLVIIGSDWGCLPSLQSLCQELGIAEQVSFVGEASEMSLVNLMQRAGVWLSSSAYESFGVALLEAMAAGCVPVVQPLPAWSQVLMDGKEGFVTDFDYPQEAARVLLQALRLSPQERGHMVSHARLVASQFSWRIIAQQFEQVYDKVSKD